MNPEEYLDRLIERREHGEGPLPVITETVAINLAAAVLILASAGMLWASAHSLPGDALYGLKQAEHQLTRNLADGQFGGLLVPCYTLTLKRIESNEAEQARTPPQRGYEAWNSSLYHPRVLDESLEKAET